MPAVWTLADDQISGDQSFVNGLAGNLVQKPTPTCLPPMEAALELMRGAGAPGRNLMPALSGCIFKFF